MGRQAGTAQVEPHKVQEYLRRRGYAGATVRSLTPLGGDTSGGVKAYGYGKPLLVVFDHEGGEGRLVVRTMSPDPFGHGRRADRAYQMVLSYDTFRNVPRHIEAYDVGSFDEEGGLVSAGAGEFFLVTNFVDGELYAGDLRAAAPAEAARSLDVDRARALAAFLADLHATRVDPGVYARHVRDTVGSGEGVFGQTDAYDPSDPVATPARLHDLELQIVRWRWQLREHTERACVTHGDFHPFNILFREGTDFSVLDCSRGGAGEAADDVTCMAVNYLFFALKEHGRFDHALRTLWDAFWDEYLDRTGDRDLLGLVPIYFSWRVLVLVSPLWYPGLAPEVRDTLLRFAERLLAGEPFDPKKVDDLLR